MLHCCIEGEKVGVDVSKIVDVDSRHDPSPDSTPAPLGERGREPPSFLFFLGLPLDGRRVPPLVHGLHGSGGAGAPLRLDLPLCSLLFHVFSHLAKNRFLYSGRSVTPIALRI